MASSKCESCGSHVARHESGVSLGSIEDGYRFLCMPCYNTEMAEYAGVEFEHPQFQPVVVQDTVGRDHEFHFTTRLLGDRIAIDAHEVRDGEREGYEFEQVELDPEGEPMEVLGRLLEKINRALSRRHIEAGELGLRIADPGVVRGRIGWDDETNGEQPMLVIDGEEYTWEDLGRMCMSYEGWQFKLEIRDPSEEV
jgi:hypothetical protein